ncbi:MAG: type II toxin-antitoxin system VapB family antitoxin [Actinomycetota bacterium]|nr:type II toxin-antitoxin system VapB family antitoxin [Actinomycetota bacterium]
MTKRLIDIDDDLLAQARELADAETIKGTVEEALRRLVIVETIKLHVEELAENSEPNRLELLEEARRVEPPPGGFSD